MEKLNELTTKKFNHDGVEYNFWGLPNEHIFKQVPWYERGLLDYLKSLNKHGVYIDVGGNIGNHSLYFLNHCDSTKLYVFEPEDFCHEILKRNLETNVNREYVLSKLAVWDKETDLKLIRFESFNNTGMSSVEESINGDGDIKANSLDNIISFNENVALIKIDAEGSEPKVLEGAISIIKMNMPVIICEAAIQAEFDVINNILLPLGYKKPTQRFNATPTYVWVKI